VAIHGKATGVVIGVEDPTRFLTDYTVSTSVETAETTGFQMQAKEYTVGQSDATVTFSGRYQGSKSTAEKVFERIQDNSDGDAFFVGQRGFVTGSRCRIGIVLRTGFDVSASVSDVVGTSINLQSTGGVVIGWCLGRGTIGTGGYGWYVVDSQDDGVDGWTGGVATLHLTGNTMNGDAQVTFQHSADGNTWADIPGLVFTVPAGTNRAIMQRTTTPLARYLRAYIYVPNGVTGTATILPSIGRI
jgi:hypothetical protein